MHRNAGDGYFFGQQRHGHPFSHLAGSARPWTVPHHRQRAYGPAAHPAPARGPARLGRGHRQRGRHRLPAPDHRGPWAHRRPNGAARGAIQPVPLLAPAGGPLCGHPGRTGGARRHPVPALRAHDACGDGRLRHPGRGRPRAQRLPHSPRQVPGAHLRHRGRRQQCQLFLGRSRRERRPGDGDQRAPSLPAGRHEPARLPGTHGLPDRQQRQWHHRDRPRATARHRSGHGRHAGCGPHPGRGRRLCRRDHRHRQHRPPAHQGVRPALSRGL